MEPVTAADAAAAAAARRGRGRPKKEASAAEATAAGKAGKAAAPKWGRGLARGPGSGTVMLVESPAKAKKIQGFLGPGYTVLASYGHIRDLPAKPGAVAPDDGFAMAWQLSDRAAPRMEAIVGAVRGAQRLVLATDPDREGEAISWHLLEELRVRWEGLGRGNGGSLLLAWAAAGGSCRKLWLITGAAACFLPPCPLPSCLQARRAVLKQAPVVERITFTEVTQRAVEEALQAPRAISEPLVHAYLARR